MSLSSITSYTQKEYEALSITPISPPPDRTTSGSPDTQIGVNLGGFLTNSNGSTMAFTITIAANKGCGLSIDISATNQLDCDVVAGANPNQQTAYYSVDMGAGASGQDWSLSFSTVSGGRTTGKWTFTRGKTRRPR